MKNDRCIPIFDPLGSRNRRYGTLSLSLLSVLAACEGPPSASTSVSPSNDEFVAAVLEAKAKHTGPEIDGELQRIQREFGYSDHNLDAFKSPDVPKARQVESTSRALVESPIAFDQTYSNAAELAAHGFRKNIAIRKPGNIVRITAEAFGNSDPMLFLIRFDDPYYQTTGFLSASGQNSFRIAAMDDDGLGRLGSTITWQSGDSDIGRYMIVAAPYANASRGRTVIRYQQTPPDGDCGPDGAWCEFYETTDPQLDTLTGGILRGHGGNRFEVLSATGVDPYLFVFNGSQFRGSANDDNIGLNSTVKLVDYSIPQPPASAYDFVLLSGYSGSGTVSYRQGFESDPRILAFRANPGCNSWKERVASTSPFGSGMGSDSTITLGEDGLVWSRGGIRDFVVTPGYLRTASFSFKKEHNNALRYLLYVDGASCPSQVIEQSTENVVRFTMSALEPGREYRVSISAVSSSGESLPSRSLTFKTITKPRAPTNLVLVSSEVDSVQRDRTEIKLRWDDNEPEEQEYRVMLNSSTYTTSGFNGIGTTAITVNNDVKLAVSVIAWNGHEASDPSNVLRFTSGPGVTVTTPSGGTTNSTVNTVPLGKWLTGDDVASRRYGYIGTFPFSGLSHTGRFEVQKVSLVFPVGSVVRLAKAGTLNCNTEGYIELTTGNSVVQGSALDRLFGSSNRIADDLHPLTLAACVLLPPNIQHVPDSLSAQVTFVTLN